MQLYTPANEHELAEVESQVQEALASILDFNLKRPEKLRELTSRILGFPNGYQQLKSAMSDAEGRHPAVEVDDPMTDFIAVVRMTARDVLETREMHGAAPNNPEQFLVEIMDDLVYDWCGTGKHVSDGINNQGLEAQVEAVHEASGGFRVIVDALADEMPELHPMHGLWLFSDHHTR